MRKLDFDKLHTASKDRMRDINEAIVLNLIREHQPISRIQITRTTGLRISTITVTSLLLEDLACGAAHTILPAPLPSPCRLILWQTAARARQ